MECSKSGTYGKHLFIAHTVPTKDKPSQLACVFCGIAYEGEG